MTVSPAKATVAVLGGLVVLMTIFRPSVARPERADQTVVSFAFWGSYTDWKMIREIVDGFEARNPDIWIKMKYVPANYGDMIQLMLSTDVAPDVILMEDEPIPAFAEYGKFADLRQWVLAQDSPLDWGDGFWPTATESFTYKGEILALPVWGGNNLIFYNRTMFREMGVPFPRDDWNLDDFVSTAQALTRDTDGDGIVDTYGFSLPSYWPYFLPFTWAFGAHYLDDTFTNWVFTDDKAVAATRFYQDLRYKYKVAPAVSCVAPGLQDRMEGALFSMGRIGMFTGGSWSSPTLLDEGVDFDVVHIPIGPTGERHTRVTWDGLCMFHKCQNKEAAWRFMSYFVSEEAQAIVGRSTRSIPALRSAAEYFIQPDNGWHEEKFIEAMSYARMQPISKEFIRMFQVMDATYTKLLQNRITPEEAVEEMAAKMFDERDRIFPIEMEKDP
jgi:multiple sugar transport system substrate-binding protein